MSSDYSHQTLGLSTLEDISSIILHSHDLHETLDNIVSLVAKRMGSDVCSIYLLEDDQQTLVLRATKGLARTAVGKISMPITEGLTGLVIETGDLVSTDNAPAHPRYKYFKASREERYASYLGLPLIAQRRPLGVIVIQTVEPRTFTPDEISILRTITVQLGGIVQNARLLDSIQSKEQERAFYADELARLKVSRPAASEVSSPELTVVSQPLSLAGVPVSAGFSHGRVFILDRFSDKVIQIAKVGSREEEQTRFQEAHEKVTIQTIYMEKRVSDLLSADDAAIFHTHLMILEDRSFTSKIHELISEGVGATRAVHEVVQGYVEVFQAMEDPYLRERSADMEDIGRRLIDALEGTDDNPVILKDKRVIVAEDIFPSDMALLDHDKILAIVTEKGNMYSHAGIMAKSLGIPAVVGVSGLMAAANVKDQIIVDGSSGHIYLNPSRHIRSEYLRLERERDSRLKELEPLKELPAITSDGVRISLKANIGMVSDVRTAVFHGAEGVGLYRTEFPYMARTSFPTRRDQTKLYTKVLEGFPGQTVNIRTLDIGGDKGLSYFNHPTEDNPFLGWRSIRVSLDETAIFKEQLAAILLSAKAGQATVMFPLISSVEEVLAVRRITDEVRDELRQEGYELPDSLPFGIMVEVPAAVQIIDRLAPLVDYVSIGTNDLIQYLLAADRNNPKIKQYYDPLHPAVLQAIKRVADVCLPLGRRVSVCGEMAADPMIALLLAGMGIREFSLSAPNIPLVKQAIRRCSIRRCRTLARGVLALDQASQVRAYLEKRRPSFINQSI